MSEQAAVWAGQFGDSYTRRNQIDWAKRVPFWSDVIKVSGARSVFELGCNAGWNLSAIQWAWPQVKVYGCDVNAQALEQAAAAGLTTWNDSTPRRAELVFTSGVLIHIAPEQLTPIMCAIVEASYRWVLAVEYAVAEETEVEYRGQKGMLWKRPYGKLYEQMGLNLRASWRLGKDEAFDHCIAWLLEKPL